MFVFLLDYIVPIEEVDLELEEHIKYLDKYYSMGKFICSGRKNPRIGGVIICNSESLEEAEDIIREDPFYIKKVAKYDLIEFYPTKYADGFEKFI
ncbi:MAG: YciI family protein [Solirubrobacterales bacterium]